MKFEEVLPALREGKKIIRKVWHPIEELSSNMEKETVKISDLLADDWEVVKTTKKVKLRDLTEEQFDKWYFKNCDNYEGCKGCPFQKVQCLKNPTPNDWWIRNKDLYSDKFLDQEVEIDE